MLVGHDTSGGFFKKYVTHVQQHLNDLNFPQKLRNPVAMATMTFQYGGHFGFKVI
jgi:hypothetical protein